jgi:hypothetical protein
MMRKRESGLRGLRDEDERNWPAPETSGLGKGFLIES